jgi:hypothetical protein
MMHKVKEAKVLLKQVEDSRPEGFFRLIRQLRSTVEDLSDELWNIHRMLDVLGVPGADTKAQLDTLAELWRDKMRLLERNARHIERMNEPREGGEGSRYQY